MKATKAEKLSVCFVDREKKSSDSSENSAVRLLLLQMGGVLTG